MKNTRIINDELVYSSKMVSIINDLFYNRQKLYREIYMHRVSIGIELMMMDILVEAQKELQIKECLLTKNVKQYMKYTDSIIYNIANSQIPELKGSKAVIARLNQRDLYKFVDMFIISKKELMRLSIEEIKQEVCAKIRKILPHFDIN